MFQQKVSVNIDTMMHQKCNKFGRFSDILGHGKKCCLIDKN